MEILEDGDCDAEGLGDNDTDDDGLCDALGLGEREIELLGDVLALGDTEGETELDGLCDADGDTLGEIDELGDCDALGEGDRLTLLDGETDADGLCEADGETLGDTDDEPAEGSLKASVNVPPVPPEPPTHSGVCAADVGFSRRQIASDPPANCSPPPENSLPVFGFCVALTSQ